MYRNRLAALTLGVLCFGQSLPLLADPPQRSPQAQRNIRGFLELGWARSFTSRKAIDAAYAKVQTNPETADVVYAYVIAKIKQRHYRPAREAIGLARKMAPKDLPLIRTELWLNVVMREFDSAMLVSDRLSKELVEAYQPFAKLPAPEPAVPAVARPKPGAKEPDKPEPELEAAKDKSKVVQDPDAPRKADPAAKVKADARPAVAAKPLTREERARKDYIETMARFLGVVMAYLDHPYRDSTDDETRQVIRDRIEKRLTAPGLQQSYRAGYRHVVSNFIAFGRQIALESDQAKRVFDEEKTRQAEELDQLRKDLAEREKSVVKEQEKLNQTLDEESKKLREADEPLRDGMRTLESRALDINRDMSFVASDLARARARLRNARDDFTRDLFAAEIFRLQGTMARLDSDLWMLQRQAADIQGQRVQLANQDERNRVDHRRASATNRATLKGVEKIRKRSAAFERRLDRQKPKAGRVRAIEVKMKAFATYASFPLEAERIRLLED